MGGGLTSFLQALAQQQGQQAQPEQMSQQGQFNPANVQAQLSGGPPPPFSFAPGQGGVGSQILNALAQAGKAATYVAESPQERESEQNRAQQLWETKQKMGLAAQQFGQQEKDRQLTQQQLETYRQGMLGEKSKSRESSAEQKQQDRKVKLAKMGMDEDLNPLPPDQMPPELRTKIELNDAAEQLKAAQANLADARAKNIPAQLKNATSAHQVALANYQLKLAQFERDTFGQVPQSMTPGGPTTGPTTTPPGTITDTAGGTQGWKSPTAPTSATKTKAQQADAVIAVGQQLIPEIRKNADNLGPYSGRWTNIQQLWGSIPPEMQRLSGLEGSMNALLPGLHQMRSQRAMQEFEKRLGTGGFKTNAEALEAGVQAMMDSAKTMRGAWMTPPAAPASPNQSGTSGIQIIRDASGRITGIK